MAKGNAKDYKEQGTIPWEYKGLGFWRSFWLNWVEIISSPGDFFSRMPKNMLAAPPLFFFVVCFGIYFAGQMTLSLLRPEFNAGDIIRDELLVGFPVLLATIFLTSLILYFFLRLFRVRDAWQNVFRIACYVDSAILLFAIAPFLGIVAGFIWGLILIIIAVKRSFRLSAPRAVLACLFSLITFAGIVLGIWVLLYKVAGLNLPVFMQRR